MSHLKEAPVSNPQGLRGSVCIHGWKGKDHKGEAQGVWVRVPATPLCSCDRWVQSLPLFWSSGLTALPHTKEVFILTF